MLKEETVKAWRKQWKANQKFGHFFMANQIPPSLKPTKHFTELEGKRGVDMDSSFVPSENTDCTACGDRFQTREHILKDCPEYEWDRDILRDVFKDIALPTIMGSTKKGILALAEFIEKSGA
ncbi:hypothetical protein C8J56DRAFT_809992 [Mycena floridula]|nr:hypothetical protein C8J56DRAFT_809992 [Mycena floridula]